MTATQQLPSPDALPQPSLRGRNREVWVGLFVLVGVLSTLVALFGLTDASMFRGRYIVRSIVDNAGGIRRGDPVLLRGVNIGRVQGLLIAPKGVEVRLEIEGEYNNIPANSTIELQSNSILGGMAAIILPGDSTNMLKNNAIISGARTKGLFDVADSLGNKAEDVLGRAQSALSKETIQNIETGSSELRKLLGEMNAIAAEQRGELRELSRSLKRAAEQAEQTASRPEIDSSLKRIDHLTAQMDETSASLTRSTNSLETILSRIEKGEGTLGRLTKDDSLYKNADATLANLNQLLADVRKNPRRYLKLSFF
ncbi:MAG: MlaD family protein [Vicinamibacteria bacterium]|jgi:phospholipid/cholesterol/gamma-HCH transport system substrate-binding protein|nr:MlaD family protein [Vicinamibacteria bacterium]